VAIIATFGGSFCHAEEVAEAARHALGYAPLGEKLLEEASRRYAVSAKNLAHSMTGPPPLLNRYTHERERNVAYLKSVLAELILEDNGFLHGPATHLLPRTSAHILKVCIIANHDYRVSQTARHLSISEKEADKKIHANDRENLEWTKYLHEKTPYDESLYDIVIPMQNTSVHEAADLICTHARSDKLSVTPSSLQAAKDFVLETKVALALIAEGHYFQVQAERGRVTVIINDYVVRLKHLEEQLTSIAMKVPEVKSVRARTGPRFKPPSSNPWADLETPPKILLVDDEKEYVHALSERLETRDIGTSVVYNGEEALEFVEKDAPDVMVLDLMMPGIDGIEVLRRIKQQKPQIEVIILTGHGTEREESLARELGAFAYLNKPVDIDVLAKIMKKAYEKARTSRNTET
jgi:CheY-like chemotaxis protein